MAADVGNLLALIDLDYRQASTDFLSQCTELNDPLNLSGLVRPPADKIGASWCQYDQSREKHEHGNFRSNRLG
jgi:hypothetical protein